MIRRLTALALVAPVALASACAGGGDPARVVERASVSTTTSTTEAPTTTSTSAPTTTTAAPRAAAAAAGALPPKAAGDPAGLAAQILQAEGVVRDPAASADAVALAALHEQVAYRALGVRPEWDGAVFAALPQWLHESVWQNLVARRELRAMHTKLNDSLPPWRIVEPAPAEELLADYKEAEARFGIEWEVLAAVNLVETAMGRIRGTSEAGAQGPMQFMPATWAAFGEGDINNPHDAIIAAARYLAHNHGATDIAGALWNYNHSHHYVEGVLAYAKVMRQDPRTYTGYHRWGVFYLTTLGDVWLPHGYESMVKIPVAEYLATHPQ